MMRRTWSICTKELQQYFYSPTAYIAFAFYVLVSSLMFYLNFVLIQPSLIDMRYVIGNTSFIYLFVIPLLTMRLVADEFKQGTDELLLTSPVGIGEIVLGKYLASLLTLGVLTLITLVYPWIMSAFGDFDLPVFFLSYLGMFLLGAAMMSIGLFASTLTNNQMVAGIGGFAILLLFWMMNYLADLFDGKFKDWIVQFSLQDRMLNLQKGVLHGADILFFITLAAVFLILSVQSLERKRWR